MAVGNTIGGTSGQPLLIMHWTAGHWYVVPTGTRNAS